MKGGKCTVLATIADADTDIDTARANAAKERAERRLASKDAEVDNARAHRALKRALTRLKVAGMA